MADAAADWNAREAARLAAHIARTADRLDALAGRYDQLRALLVPGAGQPPDWGMPTRTDPGPRVPLRLDVLDLLENVDGYLAEFLPLVRGTLRLGNGAGMWTAAPGGARRAARAEQIRACLVFMAGSLARVYDEDPGLGDGVSRGAWRLDRRAGWIFGEKPRPFALAELCPDCGVQALWLVPERMVIQCGNPACRIQRPVDTALPVHTSQSDN